MVKVVDITHINGSYLGMQSLRKCKRVLELRGGKSVDYPIITVCTGAIGWWQKEVGEGPKYLLWMCERRESERHRVVRNEKLGSMEAKGLFQRYLILIWSRGGNLGARTFSTFFAESVLLGCP